MKRNAMLGAGIEPARGKAPRDFKADADRRSDNDFARFHSYSGSLLPDLSRPIPAHFVTTPVTTTNTEALGRAA